MNKDRFVATLLVTGMGICYVAPIIFGVGIDEISPLFTWQSKLKSGVILLLILMLCAWVVFRLFCSSRPKLFLALLIACFPLVFVEIVFPLVGFAIGILHWRLWPLWICFWLHAAFYIAAWIVVWPWYRRERRTKRQMQLKTVPH